MKNEIKTLLTSEKVFYAISIILMICQVLYYIIHKIYFYIIRHYEFKKIIKKVKEEINKKDFFYTGEDSIKQYNKLKNYNNNSINEYKNILITIIELINIYIEKYTKNPNTYIEELNKALMTKLYFKNILEKIEK